jgi:CxxC motif-containing protein
VKKGGFSLVSVKTPVPIPKKYLKKMREITHRLIVRAPIKIGQIVTKNLFGKKIDLVATRKVDIKN